jgi:ribosome biogenesis GTPase
MNQLVDFGWTDTFQEKWEPFAAEGMRPARVIADFGTSLKIAAPQILPAELSGRLAHYAVREHAPKVGDWVAVRLSDNGPAVIEHVLPRRSEIARKVAGKRVMKQIIAANVDIAFVLLALDGDFSVERLKRFLYQLSINHIDAVIVLNKADKTNDVALYADQLRTLKLPIIISAATEGLGVDEIMSCIKPSHTAILLGSSGVGKSTLTNRLLGRHAQETQDVRASDDTGKHTTVHRELFVLPNGGLLIDTPGIRELQLWGTEDDLDENFDDVAALISQCKYASCTHTSESGCAIRAALRTGVLETSHYASYVAMKRELSALEKKHSVRKQRDNKKSHKNVTRQDQDRAKDWL